MSPWKPTGASIISNAPWLTKVPQTLSCCGSKRKNSTPLTTRKKFEIQRILTPTLCKECENRARKAETHTPRATFQSVPVAFSSTRGSILHLVTCVPDPAWCWRENWLETPLATLGFPQPPGSHRRLPAGQAGFWGAVELGECGHLGNAAITGEPRPPASCSD